MNGEGNKPLHTHAHPSNTESKHNMQRNSPHHQRLMTNIKSKNTEKDRPSRRELDENSSHLHHSAVVEVSCVL
jgi:hypothetical protein